MKNEQPASRNSMSLLWGIALILAGVGVLLRNLEVMPKLAEFESFSKSVVVIFYLIGIILIFGGVKKVIQYFRPPQSANTDTRTDSSDS